MATVEDVVQWQLSAHAGIFSYPYHAGAADRVGVYLANKGGALVNWNVNALYLAPWQYNALTIADGPLWYIQQAETAGTAAANSGTAGGGATRQSGAISATVPSQAESNAAIGSISGYYSLNNSSIFATYNGPFTIECWYFPSSFAAATVLYREQNAAVTHFLQCYVDTDGRLAFNMSNGATTVSDKIVASTPLTLNVWNHILWEYSAGSMTFYVNNVSQGTQALTGGAALPTFVDANATLAGIFSGGPGLVSQIAAYAAYQPASDDISNRFNVMSDARTKFTLGKGTLAAGASAEFVMGAGTANVLPPMFEVEVDGPASYGTWLVDMRNGR